MTRRRIVLSLLAAALVSTSPAAQTPPSSPNPNHIVYRGDTGPGVGKHIVWLAGDHEYRSEETLPALARILARRFGFTCTVIFTTDPKTGFIEPGSSHVTGLDVLRTADLFVVAIRFQDFPDAEMRHIVDYLDRAGPVVGVRTSTHAFQIRRPEATYLKYSWDRKDDYAGGFGRQVLGETWVGHYGTNHQQSSRLVLEPSAADHPILRGVGDVWVESGGYRAVPIAGSVTLARGQILNGMTPDSPAATDKEVMPVAWVRSYLGASGQMGRVFTTTHGASEDLRNDGFRRLMINGVLWAAGLDTHITPAAPIALVGPFRPSAYSFGGFVKQMKPSGMAGWETPIPQP